MYETADIKKGLRIELDGNPYVVIEFQFVKPGKGTAFTRTKIRNMTTGAVLDRTFKTGEKLTPADTQDRVMQFLYNDGEVHFMDINNYEQIALTPEQVGDAVGFLIENMEVTASFFKGAPITIELPNFVILEITETQPGVKGNTVTGATKPAKLSTGHEVYVPLFVEAGDRVKVDTRTGAYVERIKA